jgi:hypothetical protein
MPLEHHYIIFRHSCLFRHLWLSMCRQHDILKYSESAVHTYIYIYSPHGFHSVGSRKFTVFIAEWNCNLVLFNNFILQFNVLILLLYILRKPTLLLQTSATIQADFTISYCNKRCKHVGSPRVNSIWWMFYVLHFYHILKYCLVAQWWL